MTKVIYLSRKRQKEKPLLDILKNEKKIDYIEHKISSAEKYSSATTLICFLKDAYKFKPDIILSEGLGIIALLALIISKMIGASLVVRVKGDPFVEFEDTMKNAQLFRKAFKYLQFQSTKVVLRSADRLIPISAHIKEILILKKIKNIGGVIPVPYSTPEKKENNKTEEKFVITVTNFNFWSKVQHFPEYIGILAPILKKNNYSWYILGDGLCKRTIENHIVVKKNSDTVKFLGHINPSSHYSNASALFYISSLDSFSNVILESFSYNIPVLINDEFPVLEIKRDSEAVCIIKYLENEKLICEKVERLLFDNKYKKALIRNGKDFLENLSSEKISLTLLHELSLSQKLKYEY